jgi:hypothetical protein
MSLEAGSLKKKSSAIDVCLSHRRGAKTAEKAQKFSFASLRNLRVLRGETVAI